MGPPKNIQTEAAKILTEATPDNISLSLKNHFTPRQLILTAVFLFTASIYGAYVYFTRPSGRIASPEDGSLVSRVFEITGYTKNIPPSRKYIWIVVDAEAIGLCWPKRPIHNLNGLFKTKIHEAGPNKNFVVSLYAVDRGYHEEILKWFDKNRFTDSEPGFPMFPKSYRLDSITLKLSGI